MSEVWSREDETRGMHTDSRNTAISTGGHARILPIREKRERERIS